MATIKSFTSLEQSRKLAKILSLKSADMIWVLANPDLPMIKAISYEDSEKSKYYEVLPAWSLAALLSVIPQEIFNGEYIINITEGCDNKWILTYDHHENRNHSYYSLSIGADNLVDACCEMIIKLNELNLL